MKKKISFAQIGTKIEREKFFTARELSSGKNKK